MTEELETYYPFKLYSSSSTSLSNNIIVIPEFNEELIFKDKLYNFMNIKKEDLKDNLDKFLIDEFIEKIDGEIFREYFLYLKYLINENKKDSFNKKGYKFEDKKLNELFNVAKSHFLDIIEEKKYFKILFDNIDYFKFLIKKYSNKDIIYMGYLYLNK